MKTRALAQNTAVQMIGKGIATVLGIGTVAVLTRFLGVEGYGQFTLVMTFLSIFAVLVDFGLTLTTTQMISEKKADEEKLLGNLISLRVISAVLFLALAPVVAIWFPYDEVVKLGIAVGAASYLFGSTSQMLVGVFQKRLIMGRFVVAELLSRGAVFVGALMAPVLGLDLVGVIWLFVIGNGLQLAVILLFAGKSVKIRPTIDLGVWGSIIARSWPIGASIFFNLIYLRGDVVFLSFYRSEAEIGLYGAAYKVVDVITTVPVMFMGLVLPMMVMAWTDKNRDGFRKLLQNTFDFFVVLAGPMAVGSVAVGVPLMEFIAGPEFTEAGQVLAILGPAASIVFFGSLYGHAIVAINKQRMMTIGYFAVAVVTIAGYVAHIPEYGMWAAAWWTLGAEVMITLLTFAVVARSSAHLPKLGLAFKAVIASVVMYVGLWALPDTQVMFDICLGAVIFAGALMLLGGPKPRDLVGLLRG